MFKLIFGAFVGVLSLFGILDGAPRRDSESSSSLISETVIARRSSSSVLDWKDRSYESYRNGFEDSSSSSDDFFLGLDEIHRLTVSRSSELEIRMLVEGAWVFANYDAFVIDDADSGFVLRVSGFHSADGLSDALSYHNGRKFATVDRPVVDSTYCPRTYGPFWHGFCGRVHFFGEFGHRYWYRNVYWNGLSSSTRKVQQLELVVKQLSNGHPDMTKVNVRMLATASAVELDVTEVSLEQGISFGFFEGAGLDPTAEIPPMASVVDSGVVTPFGTLDFPNEHFTLTPKMGSASAQVTFRATYDELISDDCTSDPVIWEPSRYFQSSSYTCVMTVQSFQRRDFPILYETYSPLTLAIPFTRVESSENPGYSFVHYFAEFHAPGTVPCVLLGLGYHQQLVGRIQGVTWNANGPLMLQTQQNNVWETRASSKMFFCPKEANVYAGGTTTFADTLEVGFEVLLPDGHREQFVLTKDFAFRQEVMFNFDDLPAVFALFADENLENELTVIPSNLGDVYGLVTMNGPAGTTTALKKVILSVNLESFSGRKSTVVLEERLDYEIVRKSPPGGQTVEWVYRISVAQFRDMKRLDFDLTYDYETQPDVDRSSRRVPIGRNLTDVLDEQSDGSIRILARLVADEMLSSVFENQASSSRCCSSLLRLLAFISLIVAVIAA